MSKHDRAALVQTLANNLDVIAMLMQTRVTVAVLELQTTETLAKLMANFEAFYDGKPWKNVTLKGN